MFNQFKKIITGTSLAAFVGASIAPSVVMAQQGTVACTVLEAKSVSARDLFDFDKSDLSANGKKILSDYAANLKKMKSISTITLVGHTDGMGPVDYNMKLGQSRADAVKAYLVSQGISSNLIQTSSKGKSQLLNDEKTADGKDDPVKRQANRRVDVTTSGEVLVAGTNCPGPAVAATTGGAAVAAKPAGSAAASDAASGGLSNAAIVGGIVILGAGIAIALSGGDSGGSTGTTGTTGTR